MHTKQILKMTLRLLEDMGAPHSAAKYDLKGAMMRLGPAGFDFETFFAGVMREMGYQTKVRQVIQGLCVQHEVDVVAESPKLGRFMVECKYKNFSGDYIGIKDALYTYARFRDLVEGHEAGRCDQFDGVWLVTNTKFSHDVEDYAACKGMRIMGWRQPKGANLVGFIEERKLYPITALRTVDSFSQRRLASAGIMLCKELARLSEEDLCDMVGIPKRKAGLILAEAKQLCEEG